MSFNFFKSESCYTAVYYPFLNISLCLKGNLWASLATINISFIENSKTNKIYTIHFTNLIRCKLNLTFL